MPSFDIVSKINTHEIQNAVDQANKDTNARFDLKDDKITLIAPTDFHLKQMKDILTTKLTKREVDIRSFKFLEISTSLKEAKQDVEIKQGLDSDNAKGIVKMIKNSNLKVQAAIQGDQIRVTGKKRDDLQAVIAFLREQKMELPLQYENFRD